MVDTDDKICPCCKGELHRIGEDRSKRLDMVPAQFRIVVNRRPKYACRSCEDGVVQAEAPARLIENAGCRPKPLLPRSWCPSIPIICRSTGRRKSMRAGRGSRASSMTAASNSTTIRSNDRSARSSSIASPAGRDRPPGSLAIPTVAGRWHVQRERACTRAGARESRWHP